MKRKITLLLSLVLSSLIFISAQAYDFKVNGIYYKKSSDTHVNVVNELGTTTTPFNTNKPTGDIVIPATVTDGGVTYQVHTISSHAFRECEGITSVVIEEGVAVLGASIFRDCLGLKSIKIPESVTSFGSTGSTFLGCKNLVTANLPTGLTSIPQNLFHTCESLEAINIPEAITVIPQSAFNSCKALTSVAIPDGVTKIDNYGFSNCVSLTSINLPLALTTLGKWALGGCVALTTITIPEDVTMIDNNAFNGNVGLTSIVTNIATPASVTLGTTVFGGIDTNIPLIVPTGAEDLYKAAPQWKDFINIGTGLADLRANGIVLLSKKGALDFTLDHGMQVKIFDVTGKLRFNDYIENHTSVQLPVGVYAVKVGKLSTKAVVL